MSTPNAISPQLSDKLKFCGALCAMIVVLRHSTNLQAFFGQLHPDNTAHAIEMVFFHITEIAVPFFFVVSGFFFFRCSYYSVATYRDMLQKKARTLLVPYVLWNLIGCAIMYCGGHVDAPTSFGDWLSSLWTCQCASIMWYVRCTLLVMAAYPLYGWAFLQDKRWLQLALLVLLFSVWQPVDCRPLSTEGAFFFFLGGVMWKHAGLLDRKGSIAVLLALCAVWVALCVGQSFLNIWLLRLRTLVGIAAFWLLADRLSVSARGYLLALAPFSFFIYSSHTFFLKGFKYVAARMFPCNEAMAVASFFCVAALVVIVVVALGVLLRRYTPRLFFLLTGGRG